MKIVIIATSWGAKGGGINAFNESLAVALGQRLGSGSEVACITLAATQNEIETAASFGVRLVPLSWQGTGDHLPTESVPFLLERLETSSQTPVDWWIGHDVITGESALEAATARGGRCALIHHMSYASYQDLKSGNSTKADQKVQLQTALFRRADLVFAVGPLLAQSAREIGSKVVKELVPGFAEQTKENVSGTERINCITYGRLDPHTDRVKMGSLGVAAFGTAIGSSYERPERSPLKEGRLTVLGTDGSEDQERALKSLAEKYAGRWVNVTTLPYDDDREVLFERLHSSNLALMLSVHEGFGLSGWEAIAAEVPLIVSKNSGVFRLVEQRLGGAGIGCLRGIDVRGSYGHSLLKTDIDTVANAIIECAGDLPRARADAKRLKRLLEDDLLCSWDITASQFLDGLASLTRADTLTTGMSSAPPHRRTASFVTSARNPVAKCAELTVSTTQGSTPDGFDVLAELRFGRESLVVDNCSWEVSVSKTLIQSHLTNCRIEPGGRLGDDQESSPHVAAQGDGTWEVFGPLEDGVLRRLALGHVPLCRIAIDSPNDAKVSLHLLCRQKDLVYECDDADRNMSAAQHRVIEAFLNKCINIDALSPHFVTLSIATMGVREVDEA
ncbi:MAG: glycosyltransferase [Allosphingosinicella sp.]